MSSRKGFMPPSLSSEECILDPNIVYKDVEPMDHGADQMIASMCKTTLMHERVSVFDIKQ